MGGKLISLKMFLKRHQVKNCWKARYKNHHSLKVDIVTTETSPQVITSDIDKATQTCTLCIHVVQELRVEIIPFVGTKFVKATVSKNPLRAMTAPLYEILA